MPDNNPNEKLNQYIQSVANLEKSLESESKNWNKIMASLSKKLKGKVNDLYIVDADITNYKQLITDEIRKYSLMIYKENKMLSPLVKKRFEWYETKYQIPIKNSGDRMKLIEGDIADIRYKIHLIENHVEYLKETGSNLKQMGYTVKNRLELLDLLGLD